MQIQQMIVLNMLVQKCFRGPMVHVMQIQQICTQDGSWGGSALEDQCGTCDADSANDVFKIVLVHGAEVL